MSATTRKTPQISPTMRPISAAETPLCPYNIHRSSCNACSHKQTLQHRTYENHKHKDDNTGSNDDQQNFTIWRERGNFSNLHRTVVTK